MTNRTLTGRLLPAAFRKPQRNHSFIWQALLLFAGSLPFAAAGQTTHNFSTASTILKEDPSDYYYMKAEFTSGGVTYVISGGINGDYSNSANGGHSNSASLKKEAANQVTATLKRKDGKAFQFYGLWVKYTNGTYGYGPGFTLDYKFQCATVKTFTNTPLNATVTPYDAGGVTVTELSLSFSYLFDFFLDNFIAGPAGNLPPVITPADCNDGVRDISIAAKTKEVTTVVASDDDNDLLTYSLTGPDASLLSIDAQGKLTFNDAPAAAPAGDADADGIYTVLVTVSDGNGGTDSQTINISLVEADIVFSGCDNFTYGVKAFLKHVPALDVTSGGITRYGYSTSQDFLDANYYHVYVRWSSAASKWLITTEDEWYGSVVIYSSGSNTYPYPPDLATGSWAGNNNLPDGLGSCGTITTLGGQLIGAPTAATVDAETQDVAATSAELTGMVGDGWLNTTASFDYGTSPTLATFQTVTSAPAVVAAGNGATEVTATVTGLQQNTTYYFRVKGANNRGSASGNIKSFTTFIALPVSLLRLEARKEADGTVSILWSTASEKNNSRYLIERSTDGHTYSPIGSVAGKGNTGSTTNYAYSDQSPLAGTNYYRLSQTDVDGKQTMLGVRKVDVQKEGPAVQIYPNPVQNNQLWIHSQPATGQKLSFRLVGMSGKVVARGALNNADVQVNTTGFAKGIYLMEISNGQKIKVIIR